MVSKVDENNASVVTQTTHRDCGIQPMTTQQRSFLSMGLGWLAVGLLALACRQADLVASNAAKAPPGGQANSQAQQTAEGGPQQPTPAGSGQGSSEQGSSGQADQASGVPLKPVINREGQVKLSRQFDVWLDRQGKELLIPGEVCLRVGQLEMLVTLEGAKTHESVVAAKTDAYTIHAALLALGAKVGRPVVFRPTFRPVEGTEVEVFFRWVDAQGKTQEVRGQQWARQAITQRQMQAPFLFGGSTFLKDAQGKEKYAAEDGDFVCVSNFPTAMLDVPVESSQDASELIFEAFTERIPPLKTPVTIILRPKLDRQPPPGQAQPGQAQPGQAQPGQAQPGHEQPDDQQPTQTQLPSDQAKPQQ